MSQGNSEGDDPLDFPRTAEDVRGVEGPEEAGVAVYGTLSIEIQGMTVIARGFRFEDHITTLAAKQQIIRELLEITSGIEYDRIIIEEPAYVEET